MVSCSSNIDHTNLSLVFSTQPKKPLKYIRAFLRVYDNSGQPAFCTSHPNSNVPDTGISQQTEPMKDSVMFPTPVDASQVTSLFVVDIYH
jgi:hypothetical protein